MSWMIVSLIILAYVWYSLYRAIRREGKIKPVVWAVVIALAIGMAIPAGMLTEWGKGSWALIFDRPQMQDQNKPLYNEVFPFKEKPSVVVSWNAVSDEIGMLASEMCSLKTGSLVYWDSDPDCQKTLMDKIGKDNFCTFVDVYNHFEGSSVEVEGCPASQIGDVAPEEVATWIDKHKDVRAALLETLKVLSGEVASELEPVVQKASSDIKSALADISKIKIEDNSSVEELQAAIDTIDDIQSRIADVRTSISNLNSSTFKDVSIVIGVIDDITTRLDEVKGYISKLQESKQNIDLMGAGSDKDKYVEEYNKNLADMRKILASLPKELEFALGGMEGAVKTLKDMGPAVDIIKDAPWYQVKLDNRELFERLGGIEGYKTFMENTIKKYYEKYAAENGISGNLTPAQCNMVKNGIKPYVKCEYTKTYVDKQLKVCPASVFFNQEGTAAGQGESSGFKEDLLSKVDSACMGIMDVNTTENTTNENTSNTQVSTCTVSDQCQCNAQGKQTTVKAEYFKTYVVIDDGKSQKRILIDHFVPSQNICSAIAERLDTSFDKVYDAIFDNMYCGGATVNIASYVSPYFGTKSFYLVSDKDRKPLKVLSTRGLIEMGNANRPNPTGIFVFLFVMALIIGGMEMMLRLFLPPIISSTSQYGGASWVWLFVIGIMVFFLEAFFAFTIGGLLVTWWKVLTLPPIMM